MFKCAHHETVAVGILNTVYITSQKYLPVFKLFF